MITAVIDAGQHYCQAVSDLWQWDYGQTLRIQGVKLPAAVEVQFSTTERIGETVTRIGVTKDGVTEVPIPDTLLDGGGTTQDYTIYAFVYIENGDSGKTEYRVSMKVRARPKPEAHATPEEGELFRQAIVAVAESADRAESARKSAQVSADEAKTSKENAETAAKVAEAFKTETETAKAEAVQAAADATAAKKSAEEARAAAEKAKQDADADKEATEAAQAKAEAAQVAAENAEAEAKKAQTATETARRETETAKTAVETMQSTVAGYADNANIAKESAETAKAEAETAKNDAAQAKEAAEKAKSGTAADREVTEAASKAAQVSATSAEESAKKAETAKEEIQESTDQIQKNATEIDSLKEDLTNKITKFYASNQGETHLSDSDNGKIMDMVLYGRCEQQTTTGKNLFDVAKTDNSILQASGINIVKVDRQSGLIEATFSKNYQQLGIIIPEKERDAIYTMKLHQVNDKNDKIDVRVYTIKNNMFSEYVNGVYSESNTIIFTFNITAGTQSAVWFRPAGAYNAENKNVCKFSNIQLEKGSEATSFEPYTGSQPSPSPNYPQEIKGVVNPIVKLLNEDGTQFNTVTLPYTLNAIPVSSGGNVTIDGQQYIADYVERGKLVRMVDTSKLDSTQSIVDKTEWLLAEPQEVPLTDEEIRVFKALATYYPVTNISISSEQLDGYAVFNYPISMANGWNYVKKQLNDNRDYIYDMDLQSAEAYVNSEYAVALTELEV